MRVIYKVVILCTVVASYKAAVATDSLIEIIKKNFKTENVEPLVLTISSSVWHLLETEQDTINKAVRSISIPEFGGKISKFQYKVSDAKFELFTLPSDGISFQKYDRGVYLKIKGVQFKASAKAKVGLAKKKCLLCLLPSLKGGIIVTSKNVSLNVELVWHDCKFTPRISMESNIKLKFTGGLKIINIVNEFVDIKALLKEKFENLIDENIEKKLDEGVNNLGNPHLQQLKAKISRAGYKFLFESPIDWTVKDNNLRIAVKLNGISNTTTQSVAPFDRMVCLSADIVRIFLPLFSKVYSTSRAKRQAANGLVFTCIQPELNCKGSTCSICTDFNIRRSSDFSSSDRYHNCIPKINFKDWLWKNFGQYLTSKNVQKKMLGWIEKKADGLERNADLLIESLFDF